MSFTAKFGGICDRCGENIEPGQQIRFEDPDERTYVHVEPPCEIPTILKPAGPVCDGCRLELLPGGGCSGWC